MAPPLELYNSPDHSDPLRSLSDTLRSVPITPITLRFTPISSDHSPDHSDPLRSLSDPLRSVPITTPPSSLTTLFAHTLADTTLLQEAILLRLK